MSYSLKIFYRLWKRYNFVEKVIGMCDVVKIRTFDIVGNTLIRCNTTN